jgi:hypothetical protein
LTAWLGLPSADAGISAAHVWSAKLLDPSATLATLLAGPTADPRRSGILTDAGLLALRPTISTRGAWMWEKLFCMPVPPAPANLPPFDPNGPGVTRREKLENQVSQASCQGCHTILDPPGDALEHFDAMGNYRDIDNGKPVDSSGTIGPLMLSFAGIDDLAPQLASSCSVALCFSKEVMSDAFGASSSGNPPFTDQESNHVANAFANSNFSIRELVKAIVQTPSFLR